MSKLTKKQNEVLKFIINYIKDYDFSPSYREIGDYFNITSPATIHEHIQNLKSKGYVKLDPNMPRSLELTSKVIKMGKTIELPLVGYIAAGSPIEAIENNDTMAVPAELVRDDDSYVLKVKGESMIEEGILDGDYVIVERNYYPRNGDVVVALLDNTYVTLKKFFREKNAIRLQPANSSMEPIYVKDVAIRGIVKAIIRKFA